MSGTKKIVTKRIVICLILVVVLVGSVFGGIALYNGKQMNKIINLTAKEGIEYTLKGNSDGVITVGIIKNGEASFTVYGKDGKELPQSVHTYEIGSLTKTFTAALVQRAVAEGTLSLDGSIDEYLDLPEKVDYPTIKELLTHTSGYKEYYFESPMTANFFNRRNDFYGIGDSTIIDRLKKLDVEDKDYGFNYSNFGYAVLGLILEKTSNTEFTTLMNGFIQNELNLNNTAMSNGNGDLGNLWEWVPGDTYMSAGALTSNIEDMLAYAELCLNGGEQLKMLKTVNATTKDYERLSIRIDEIGYGWLYDNQNGIVWHNGGTGHYNCYLGMDLKNQTAVVVLSNLSPTYRIPSTVIGVKLLEELNKAE